MLKKRIGNDISFTWRIYRKESDDVVPETFEGKDVIVELISPLQRPAEIENISISAGVVGFVFKGKEQRFPGSYTAVLLENKGKDGMVTLDVVNAVTLVAHSYMEEDGDDGDVIEATSVELESEIGQGIDAYTKAETDALLEGKYDKVDGIRFLAERKITVTDENGQATTTVSPNEVQFEEQNGTQSAEIWLNGGYLRLNDTYRTSPTGNKIATDLELADKQDVINDLATIRNGAQAGATAVQPSEITPIDNRLDNVEYCLGDYLKDIYVFNWENHTTTTTEPIYTTRELYTVDGNRGFQTCDCKLTAGSATISAIYLGGLGSGTMYFTQAGTVTMYLVLLSNPSSTGRLIRVYDALDNIIETISTYDIPYNSQHICTPITFEVEAGYYLKIDITVANMEHDIWLGQINFEIAGVKQIDKDVHANSAAIEVIEQKIPAQASSSNQLADKNFVNSSIATATATYRGSYNLVSDLSLTVSATQQQIATALATKMEALSITPDNNDYCFVQVPTADDTPTEIARIDRYKYDGTAWAYEYSLNNSSFTAAQWAALNSGITSGLVTKLSALPTNNELTTALEAKLDTITQSQFNEIFD